jgi:hypothetical protein
MEIAGGAADVWGNWHAIRRGTECGSGERPRLARHIAATVIQAIELEIIAPIFDIARTYGNTYQFGIVLFQHDGATISFRARGKREEKAKSLLRDAVETKAKGLGVHTTLEFADLEPADVPSVVRSQDQSVEEIVAELEDGLRAAGLFLPPEQCDFCGGEGDWYEGEYAGHWCCDLHAHLVDEADDAIKASFSEEYVGPALPMVEQACLFL